MLAGTPKHQNGRSPRVYCLSETLRRWRPTYRAAMCFRTDERDLAALRARIEAAIEKKLGVKCSVV